MATQDTLLGRVSTAVDESRGRFVKVLATTVCAMILYGLLNSMSLQAVTHGDLASAGIDIGVGLTVFVFAIVRAGAYFVYLARQVAAKRVTIK
jgi:hypothetical protein